MLPLLNKLLASDIIEDILHVAEHDEEGAEEVGGVEC